MITAKEAKQKCDEKKAQNFISKAEKAIQTAIKKGLYSCTIEDMELKDIPESAINQLKENGYSVKQVETTYYRDEISNIEISWRD